MPGACRRAGRRSRRRRRRCRARAGGARRRHCGSRWSKSIRQLAALAAENAQRNQSGRAGACRRARRRGAGARIRRGRAGAGIDCACADESAVQRSGSGNECRRTGPAGSRMRRPQPRLPPGSRRRHGCYVHAARLSLIWRADGLADVLEALASGFGAVTVLPVHPKAGRTGHSRSWCAPRRPAARRLRCCRGSSSPIASGRPTPEAEAVLRAGLP